MNVLVRASSSLVLGTKKKSNSKELLFFLWGGLKGVLGSVREFRELRE